MSSSAVVTPGARSMPWWAAASRATCPTAMGESSPPAFGSIRNPDAPRRHPPLDAARASSAAADLLTHQDHARFDLPQARHACMGVRRRFLGIRGHQFVPGSGGDRAVRRAFGSDRRDAGHTDGGWSLPKTVEDGSTDGAWDHLACATSRTRVAAYAPEWTDQPEGDPGITIVQLCRSWASRCSVHRCRHAARSAGSAPS